MKLENLKMCNVCESRNIRCIDESHNIYRCRNCGYIFNNPRPTAKEIAKYYSQFDKYDFWLTQEKSRDLLCLRRLKMIKKHKKAGNLLDIGAGIGQFLHFAKDNFDIRGTEVSESAVRVAKEKYNIDLFLGEVENINFGNLKFDVITIFHVLEHVPNPSSLIKKCRELINREGIIIIAVPNDIVSLRAMTTYMLSVLKIDRFKNRGNFGLPKIALNGSQGEIHLSHFKISVLKTLLYRSNFTLIENWLDPYYAIGGYKKIINDLFYLFCLLVKKIFGINIYDTIWLVAKAK
jgi:SAM-dependent methyltransferase